MNHLEPIPTTGSQLGRYEFLREVSKGYFGALYELRAEAGNATLGALGRVVTLPADLDAETAQSLGNAIKGTLSVSHDWAVAVADFRHGTDWALVVYDYVEGFVVKSLHRRAQESRATFPAGVAVRIALDVIEGISQSVSACRAAGIEYGAGGIGSGSLFFCRDGRTRSLDGQLMYALTRSEVTRNHVSVIGFPSPELVDAQRQPDERADVFAVGALLWELLTCRELTLGSAVIQSKRPQPKAPNVSLSVPRGMPQIPRELAQVVNAALELDPTARPASLLEFRNALVGDVEVPTHEQVLEYFDALMPRDSARNPSAFDAKSRLSDALRSLGVVPGEFVRESAPHQGNSNGARLPRPTAKPSVGAASLKPSVAPFGGDTANKGDESRRPPPVKSQLPKPPSRAAKSQEPTPPPPAANSEAHHVRPLPPSSRSEAPGPKSPIPPAKLDLPPAKADSLSPKSSLPLARDKVELTKPSALPKKLDQEPAVAIPTATATPKPLASTPKPPSVLPQTAPPREAAPIAEQAGASAVPAVKLPLPIGVPPPPELFLPNTQVEKPLAEGAGGDESDAEFISVLPDQPDPVAPAAPRAAEKPTPTASTTAKAEVDLDVPWKAPSKRVLRLNVVTLVIGVAVTAAIAVGATLLIQGGASKASNRSSIKAAAAARSTPTAAPVATTAPNTVAETPSSAPAAPNQGATDQARTESAAPGAAASAGSSADAPTHSEDDAKSKSAAAKAMRPAAPAGNAPKSAPRRRGGGYVPSDL